MRKIRVADYIAKFIEGRGIKHIFLVSGGGMMHLTDGLACNKKIKAVCTHHEQAAAMALEAYSKITENLGVGFFTSGPGGTNAITGLAGAWLDSVPCLFFSGQAKRKETTYLAKIPGLRQIGVQEINILAIVESLTKYSAFVDKPEEIRYHLEKALYLAKEGRPGPAWLDIPLDVQGALIDPRRLKGFKPVRQALKIKSEQIKRVVSYLKLASRPVVLAGYGVRIAGAINLLKKLVEKYKIPLVTTFLGIDIIENNHPCYIGRIGINGTRAGNLAMQNADLLIVIGSSLPVAETNYEYETFAREAKVVVVDIDKSSHQKKTIRIDDLIEGDAKEFILKLLKSLAKEKIAFDQRWLKTALDWKKRYPVCLSRYKKLKNRINIYYLVDQLTRRLKNGDVVVTDAGSSFFAGSQGVIIKKGVRYITSGGFATMGYGLPAGIGISTALNNKRVVCITGDGSFQQNLQELQTVKHYQLPLKIFILNNQGYLSIRTSQKRFCQARYLGEGPRSGVSFPKTEKIAKAYGIKFIRVSRNDQLDKALATALNYPGAIICEVMTPREQLIIPKVSSMKKPDGTMVSKPLEDMFPFLSRKEFRKNMFIKPLEE